MTKYAIYQLVDSKDRESFSLVGHEEASGAQAAVRQYVSKQEAPEEDTQDVYLVIPENNITRVEVGVERPQPQLSFKTTSTTPRPRRERATVGATGGTPGEGGTSLG